MIRKIKDQVKQFGEKAVLQKFLRHLVRPFYKQYSQIVLAMPAHEHCDINECVKRMSSTELNYWSERKLIREDDLQRFSKFLNESCNGFYIEENGELAAWGFVQTKGQYQYGRYFMEMPLKVHILKNLFVKSEYRGKSYGKLINNARVNDIPADCIPVSLVIPENRYALRNLKQIGFEEFLVVKHVTWFSKFERRKITITQPGEIATILLGGF